MLPGGIGGLAGGVGRVADGEPGGAEGDHGQGQQAGDHAAQTALWLAAALVLGALAAGAWFRLTRTRRPERPPHPRATMTAAERMSWRMPPLALLRPVQWSAGTKLAMLVLRGYSSSPSCS